MATTRERRGLDSSSAGCSPALLLPVAEPRETTKDRRAAASRRATASRSPSPRARRYDGDVCPSSGAGDTVGRRPLLCFGWWCVACGRGVCRSAARRRATRCRHRRPRVSRTTRCGYRRCPERLSSRARLARSPWKVHARKTMKGWSDASRMVFSQIMCSTCGAARHTHTQATWWCVDARVRPGEPNTKHNERGLARATASFRTRRGRPTALSRAAGGEQWLYGDTPPISPPYLRVQSTRSRRHRIETRFQYFFFSTSSIWRAHLLQPDDLRLLEDFDRPWIASRLCDGGGGRRFARAVEMS